MWDDHKNFKNKFQTSFSLNMRNISYKYIWFGCQSVRLNYRSTKISNQQKNKIELLSLSH